MSKQQDWDTDQLEKSMRARIKEVEAEWCTAMSTQRRGRKVMVSISSLEHALGNYYRRTKQYKALEKELADARAEIDKAQVIIAELPSMAEMEYGADCIAIRDTEIARLKGELADARAEVERVHTEMDGMFTAETVEGLEVAIGALESRVGNLTGELKDARAEIARLRRPETRIPGRGRSGYKELLKRLEKELGRPPTVEEIRANLGRRVWEEPSDE